MPQPPGMYRTAGGYCVARRSRSLTNAADSLPGSGSKVATPTKFEIRPAVTGSSRRSVAQARNDRSTGASVLRSRRMPVSTFRGGTVRPRPSTRKTIRAVLGTRRAGRARPR